MKCGLICARSARTSARISRWRDSSSSASSSWPETQLATSSVARSRLADGWSVSATSAPATRSSITSGLAMACCTRQPAVSQSRSARPATTVPIDSTARAARASAWSA